MAASLVAVVAALATGVQAGEHLDRPVAWYEDDRRPIPMVAERDPHLYETGIKDAVFRPLYRFLYPGLWLRRLAVPLGADHVMPAANINALDEAPNSTWFTNRLGMYDIAPERCAIGPGGDGPDRSSRWEVIGAKTGGVTPGFRVRDGAGQVHLLKFDPPGWTGMTLTAGIISNRILWAAGYNVSRDEAITFSLDDVTIAHDVKFLQPGGGDEITLTPARLDSLLNGLQPGSRGTWRALSSQFVSGWPVGFFDYQGRRKDDPNDTVHHENRRELRGLRVFAAWLNHFDTKQENSLDVFVETEPGKGHVVHYLIDFASTLGAAGRHPDRKWGHEYTVDPQAIMGNILALGFHESRWRGFELREDLPEVGFWKSEGFEPQDFKPILANSAFAHLTDRDGYWAAKIVSAFTAAHLDAIVAEARYAQPEAAAYVARILGERRDIIARYWFDRVTPLDHFRPAGDRLVFSDLGNERGAYEGIPHYRYRTAACDVDRGRAGWTAWQETRATSLPLAAPGDSPYLACEVTVDYGDGWRSPVRVFVERATGRVAALER